MSRKEENISDVVAIAMELGESLRVQEDACHCRRAQYQ